MRLTPNESDTDMPTHDDPGQGVLDEESEDESGETPAFTPTSTRPNSPLGQTFADVRVRGSRLGPSMSGESSETPRLTQRRSRSCLASGRATSAMASHLPQELPYRLPMGMLKFEGHMDSVPCDVAMPEHRDSLPQAPEELRLAQPVPPNVFERNFESHFGAREMMHALPYSAPCHHPGSGQAWMGMMPPMGPEPPDHVFGIHPRMATAHQKVGNSLFGAAADEMGNTMDTGLPLMGGTPFQDFSDSHRRALPFRIDTSHPGMISLDDGMNLGSGTYYPL